MLVQIPGRFIVSHKNSLNNWLDLNKKNSIMKYHDQKLISHSVSSGRPACSPPVTTGTLFMSTNSEFYSKNGPYICSCFVWTYTPMLGLLEIYQWIWSTSHTSGSFVQSEPLPLAVFILVAIEHMWVTITAHVGLIRGSWAAGEREGRAGMPGTTECFRERSENHMVDKPQDNHGGSTSIIFF